MELVTNAADRETPVGALTAKTVHLLMAVLNDGRVYGLCDKQVRGHVFIRTDAPADKICQACIDERDWQEAMRVTTFRVTNSRVQLGFSNVAGGGMRYGHRVTCHGCLDDRGHGTVIWSTNGAGQGEHARKIAQQHLLEHYRADRAATTESETS